MAFAIDEARAGMAEGGEPVGAVILRDGVILGRGRNRLRQNGDPTAHAEMEAYRDAARRLLNGLEPDACEAALHGASVFTTAMPCEMCAGAILRFRAERVVVAEIRTYRPAGTRGLLKRQGIAVSVSDSAAMAALVERYFDLYPERRAGFEQGDDRPLL